MKILKLLSLLMIVTVCLSLISCGGSGGGESNQGNNPTPPTNPPLNPPGMEQDTGELVTLANLTPGICADVVDEINGVEFMNTKNCDEAHQFEIAGSYDLDGFGDEYPGSIAIDRRVHQDCRPLFESHTGEAYTGRDLGIETITPSISTWRNGDRSVICLVVNADRSMLSRSVAL